MTQTVLAYAATALAAGWVIWSVVLPRSLKQRLKARRRKDGGCGDDGCGCGD